MKKAIFVAVLAIIIAALILNPIIKINESSISIVDLKNPLPHYEFSNNSIDYIEKLSIDYTIKTPFALLWINTEKKIVFPRNYKLMNNGIGRVPDCIKTNGIWHNSLKIEAISSQFNTPECILKINYFKEIKKSEIIREEYNASWKKDFQENKYYEEDGIGILNLRNFPINNYVFIYNQTISNQISRNLSDCSKIEVYLDDILFIHKENFFNNNGIVAIKLDLGASERKDFILRCYH